MDTQKTRTWAEISLGALRHNCRQIQRSLPAGCGLMGVVKADAYGHGAAVVAERLRQAGAAWLAVACPEEALALRQAGESLPILVLGASDPAWAPVLAEHRVAQTVECREKGQALAAALHPGQRLQVHIKLDTGMGRLGFPWEGAGLEQALEVLRLPALEPVGVFTHFAVSDEPETGREYTQEQFRRFRAAVSELEQRWGNRFPQRHCANSGGVLFYRQEGYTLDLVRPGLLTYGVYPGRERGGLDLRPVMSLRSRVAAVTHHRKGDTVSYGRTWTAQRDTTLAVLPVGYADGLHRCLSGRLEVLIRGRRFPQVGRICMDMCMVDVTGCPDLAPGEVATIFGRDGEAEISAAELAEKAGTIPYEILCAVSPRVPRICSE